MPMPVKKKDEKRDEADEEKEEAGAAEEEKGGRSPTPEGSPTPVGDARPQVHSLREPTRHQIPHGAVF